MRTLDLRKNREKNYICKVNKKRNFRNNKGTWSYSYEIRLQDFEDINEIIRLQRTRRSVSKGYWKIMPKDSCEVYKDRRKRQIESERSQNVKEANGEKYNVANKKRKDKKRIGKKKKEHDKRLNKKQKGRIRKRRHRCSSCASTYCGTSISSATNYSDMDYE